MKWLPKNSKHLPVETNKWEIDTPVRITRVFEGCKRKTAQRSSCAWIIAKIKGGQEEQQKKWWWVLFLPDFPTPNFMGNCNTASCTRLCFHLSSPHRHVHMDEFGSMSTHAQTSFPSQQRRTKPAGRYQFFRMQCRVSKIGAGAGRRGGGGGPLLLNKTPPSK